MPRLTRRQLLAGLGATGLALPRGLFASPSTGKRFLFVFANGGWDPTYVFAPCFDKPGIDVEQEATTAQLGGLRFVDAPGRPAVRSFFEKYADRTCILNGIEVRSVTHERCRRLIMTGSAESTADDWASRVAAQEGELLMPCLVASGPSYTWEHTASVVRLGSTGQVGRLLDGTALTDGGVGVPLPSDAASAMGDSVVNARIARALAAGVGGSPELEAYAASLSRLDRVRAIDEQLDLEAAMSSDARLTDRLLPVYGCLEGGLSRCAVIQHDGLYETTWDSHAGISIQSSHFQTLFDDLSIVMHELETRPGPQGGSLADEVVVVVLSEMGRAPRLNSTMGKDHWTFTSAMLIGPGVAGGRVIGDFDDEFRGMSIDLADGGLDEGGAALTSAHLGATVLAMADMDPEALLGVPPIAAAMG